MRPSTHLLTLTLIPLIAACSLSGAEADPELVAMSTPRVLATNAVVDTGEGDELVEPEVLLFAAQAMAIDETFVEDEPLAEPEPLSTSWTVRRGESLAHFARWAELPVETVAEASDRALGTPLQVGDTLVVPGDADVRAKVEQSRQRHHQRRAEAYLASRGGADGTAFHTVRTGETGWSVANGELGLPVWLLEAYNPAVDLDRLRPGEQLLYPVVDDTVAEVTPGSTEAP